MQRELKKLLSKMQVVLLAGGLGTRISEETDRMPKPMVSIGGKPILWHIMKYYSSHGLNDFIICGGYKVDAIIEYFSNYRQHNSDLKIDIANNRISYLSDTTEPWTVTIINTGEFTQTGGRLKKIKDYLRADQPFCMTYGDGLSNVDIANSIHFHMKNNLNATLTAVRPPARFGVVTIKETRVENFSEKPSMSDGHINGGFFVLNPNVIDLIDDDSTIWENAPLQTLASTHQLGAYLHNGFWQPMDTLRDRRYLEQLWAQDIAPWKNW